MAGVHLSAEEINRITPPPANPPRGATGEKVPTSMTQPSSSLSRPTQAHLEKLREFYDARPEGPSGPSLGYRRLLAYYYRQLISEDASVLEVGCGDGSLLEMLPGKIKAGVDLSPVQIDLARARIPDGDFKVMSGEEFEADRKYDVIIVSDTLNQAADCQLLLSRLQAAAHSGTRLIINVYNALWSPLLMSVRRLGWAAPAPSLNWLSRNDVFNFLILSDWEFVRQFGKILLPFADSLVAAWVNRWIAPIANAFALTLFVVARPFERKLSGKPGVSIIVPARNEAGNIEAAIQRTPVMSPQQEWIFVEGGSTDDTWDAIQKTQADHPDKNIRAIRQTKKGKANAVWEGFDLATGDILMILDADLTMPPEELPKFYQAIVNGKAEFANGVRLVYPMDNRAMQFLNLCANKFFAMLFTWLLEQPVKDTLCGTKVLTRTNYDRVAAGRGHFGNFDPFGDFDLLFGAARLNLKIADIPIRYRERTYGQTNISRWTHGAILLRMAFVGSRKLKFW